MTVLDVQHLVKKYREKTAVDDICFSLQEGKCTALLGPNGAGKTTTINMIAGLIKPSEGTISSPMVKQGNDLRALIGFLPQYPSFYDWMSGEEYLTFVGRLMKMDAGQLKKRVSDIVELVGLTDGYKRRIGGYSGGMRQRLGIAQALIHQPKLVLLDEPVSALDPFGRREVLELLKKLKDETTILISTHILNDAEEVCDSVLFLNEGRLIEQGSIEDVKNRHVQNMIRVVVRDNPNQITSIVEGERWLKALDIIGNDWLFSVNDIEEARARLMKLALQHRLPVVKFEVNDLTLEEVFTKVVKG